MHDHNCPRCQLPFAHERFVLKNEWSDIACTVAMHLHRFYGACQRCIDKYIKEKFGGNDGSKETPATTST